MIVQPNQWYGFEEVIPRLRVGGDGTHLYEGDARFKEGRLSAALVRSGHTDCIALQCCLYGVSRYSVDGLPALSELAWRLIGENLVPLPQAQFPFQLHVEHRGEHFRAAGLVCAELMIRSLDHRSGPPEEKLREVESAFERGLLDDSLRDHADFRLKIRPVIAEFNALRTSGYVPDWQVNVLFSAWRQVGSDDWVSSPVPDGDPDSMKLAFRPTSQATSEPRRGFRITDLFSNPTTGSIDD